MSILAKYDEVVIFDLEATCEDKSVDFYFDKETIEIGSVKVKNHEIIGEVHTFIRPKDTVITAFCTELTTITDRDVAQAPAFREAILQFSDFIGNAKICSWGDYDRKQLIKDFERHELEPAYWLKRHTNLKKEFADLMEVRQCGMRQALALCGLELQGVHHRGIDDARNITQIYLYLQDRFFPNKWLKKHL